MAEQREQPHDFPFDPDTAHRPADDREEVYYEGSPMLRSEVGKVMAWGFAGLAMIALAVVALVLGVAWWPGWWLSAVLVVLGILCFLIPVLIKRTTRYRVTNYRIDYERGILNKKVDTMELWHVDDISFQQSLVERLLGVGTILVVSDDRSTPNLRLDGIPSPRPVFEALKQRIIAVKRQRGVIKMDAD